MCSFKFAAVVVFFAVFLAYFFYHPLPEKICEPRSAVLKLNAMFKATKRLAALGSWLRLGSKYQIIRRFQSIGFAFDPDTLTDPEFTITDMLIKNVSVRVYHPKSVMKMEDVDFIPAIIYFHGGGWVIGSVALYHHFTRELSKQTQFIVISVDYRLAPEYPYPAAYDDCLLVTEHVLEHGRQLRIDTDRVAVMGDSAGGNLAAAVAFHLSTNRPEHLPPLRAQMLIYPAVQAYDLRTPSYHLEDPVILSAHEMATFWALYLDAPLSWVPAMLDNNHTSPMFKRSVFAGYLNHEQIITGDYTVPRGYQKPASKDFGEPALFEELVELGLLDPLAMPLAANSLKGLTPAYVMTAEFDVLRDEGVAYVNRLRREGVAVTHRHARDGFHGMMLCVQDSLIELEATKAIFLDMVHYLKQKLTPRTKRGSHTT